jgi:hypothetical protein
VKIRNAICPLIDFPSPNAHCNTPERAPAPACKTATCASTRHFPLSTLHRPLPGLRLLLLLCCCCLVVHGRPAPSLCSSYFQWHVPRPAPSLRRLCVSEHHQQLIDACDFPTATGERLISVCIYLTHLYTANYSNIAT